MAKKYFSFLRRVRLRDRGCQDFLPGSQIDRGYQVSLPDSQTLVVATCFCLTRDFREAA